MTEEQAEPRCIEDHGIIGNMRSAALVAIDGTIDFFCYPRFDSPTVFAALLDGQKGGSFRLEPQIAEVRYKQLYLPDTNILLTRFLAEDGIAEVMDFMPVVEDGDDVAYAHQVVRMVKGLRGTVRFKARCAPRFDYARGTHEAARDQKAICFRSQTEGCHSMALHATVPMDVDGLDGVAEFTVKEGECVSFAFGKLDAEQSDHGQLLNQEKLEALFQRSVDFWRGWVKHAQYRGRWREIVLRSALVLKLLSSPQDGTLVAAVTFGLPEQLGGARNWDYRYSWLRDASFSLYALVRLGFSHEAQRYGRWLRDRLIEGFEHQELDGPMRVLYRVDGGTDLDETELGHLAGYRNSTPVRVGNGAKDQLQLDIYGEMMDAVYLANKYGPGMAKDGWRRLIRVLDWLGKNWNREDEGIWEVRSGRKHLLHSRLMCWVAFDRAIRLMDKRSLDGPIDEWIATRRAIDEDIWANFWDEEVQSFVYARGEKAVDGAMLLMPLVRYVSPSDPKWRSTLHYIEDQLIEDSLVFRYLSEDDGLEGPEGSFAACSFWYIECLARSGMVDKARLLFDKILGYANHLGLYAEQIGPSGEHLGNFPQALTHLALISAATYLDRAIEGIKEPWS